MTNFLKRFLQNHVLANLCFLLVIVIGFMTYNQLPRERDPTINFNWIQITTVFPGASAADVEKRVSEPLEKALQKISDTRFVSSISRDSVSSILVRFRDLPEATFTKRVVDLRREIQNKEKELPEDVESPTIMEITSANGFPSATLVAVSKSGDNDQLRRFSRNLQKSLEQLTGVDQVDTIGLKDPELQVHFDPARLSHFGINATDLANSVQSHFIDVSAGSLEIDQTRWVIRWIGTDTDPSYLASLPIITAQGELPIGEVAQVGKGREKARDMVHYEGKSAVMLTVRKQANANDLKLVDNIKDFIKQQNYTKDSTGVELHLIDDQSFVTRNALNIMQTNAFYGLILVLLSTWIFLGFKIAFIVSIGIPFTLAATICFLSANGHTLNISVLLGIVISLGMLVDDSVVVVEAIYYRLSRGMDKISAVVSGLKEVFAPVTTSIMTTISAFIPLMLLPGILGKFMFVIPLVVTVALLFSLVEAYWMLPAHINALNINFKNQSKSQQTRIKFTNWVRLSYVKLLIKVFRKPKLTFAALIFLFVFSIFAIASGMIKVNFFANDPIRMFYVNVEMPTSAPVEETIKYTSQIELKVKDLLNKGEARNLCSYAGLMFTETEAIMGENVAQVIVSLNPHKGKMRTVDEIVEAMRAEVMQTPGPKSITFLKLNDGPPTSKPINIKVRGDNFAIIRQAIVELKQILSEIDGVHDISDNDSLGQPELKLKPNLDAINRAGLNPADIARTTRLLVDGEVVASLQHEGEELNIRVRANQDAFASTNSMLQQSIMMPSGGSIRLADLVTVEYDKGQSNIRHYNFLKAITITADLDKSKIDTLAANNILKEKWESYRNKYPSINLDFSGELDDIQESIDSMPRLFLIGMGLIYLILGTQFRSYWQPLMILATVPLAFCGVTIGLLVSSHPLSLYTLYGIVALSGISVNAAIVLISAANDRLKLGMSVLHATLYAARRRVIPILITSLTTIAGLFSLATGLGGKSLLWGPVATAIVWGLVVSTMLTLLVIPLLYRFFMKRKYR